MTAVKHKTFSDSPVEIAYKQIRLREQHNTIAREIESKYQLTPAAARVLAARGYVTDEVLEHYITPTLKLGLPDPNQLKGLTQACKIIKDAVEQDIGIAICCDFDVDGLSGGSQVYHFFKTLAVRSAVFVPDRFTEGYGLNAEMIRKIAKLKFGLVICIDYGTSNATELTLARELGLQTIVIDHHHVGKAGPPPCDVFINPQQEGCGFADGILCAAGLAWYLIVGLRGHIKAARSIDPKSYLDLACLGTICDMVPLIGANRIIAKRGLEALSTTQRVGLQALKCVIGIGNQVRCSHVGFGIGPRLNAAGRMVHGEIVVDLLTTSDTKVSAKLAKKLNKLNLERQETEQMVKDEAIARIHEQGVLTPGLVVWDKDFHTGVIGIVAQRLVETFYRPAAVMGYEEGFYKGSVRGIKGLSVVKTLEAVGHLLVKFGGHDGAGGFSVAEEKVGEFAEAFIAECARRLADIPTEPFIDADTKVKLHEVTPQLVNELKQFEPFGMGNPGPQLLIEDLKVKDIQILKNAHMKVIFSDGQSYLTGLLWRHTSHPDLEIGRVVKIACKPEINAFNGRQEMQAMLSAIETQSA